LLLGLLGAAYAQQKTPAKPQLPTKPEAPSVNCSDAPTSKACGSFKQLLEAHDKDILDSISSPTSYVCFRPNEDVFLIFHVKDPTEYFWLRLDDSSKGEKQYGSPVLAEFRNGLLYRTTNGIGYWFRSSPTEKEPIFKSRPDENYNDGATVIIAGTEISIDHTFKNQNGGTTQYSLTIRRSTGRFIETFASADTPGRTHSGTCLIYR
jgi:hypothetical protein